MKLVEALGKQYSIEILGAAKEPMSTSELSDSLDIPPATCYRRVEHLASVGLLEECESECEESRRATLYRRTTDAVGIRFGRTPSVLTWDYVARLSEIDAPASGGSTEGGDAGRTDLPPVHEVRSNPDDRTAAAADGETKS